MNRRNLLRGVLGVAGALVLPPSVADVAAEVERRYWSLGAMPGCDPRIIDMWEQDFITVEIGAADWMYGSFRVGEQVPVFSQDGGAIIEWATVTGVSGPYPLIVGRNDV